MIKSEVKKLILRMTMLVVLVGALFMVPTLANNSPDENGGGGTPTQGGGGSKSDICRQHCTNQYSICLSACQEMSALGGFLCVTECNINKILCDIVACGIFG